MLYLVNFDETHVLQIIEFNKVLEFNFFFLMVGLTLDALCAYSVCWVLFLGHICSYFLVGLFHYPTLPSRS